MVTPLYPYFPHLLQLFLLARQDIVPRPIRSARIQKKVTRIREMPPLQGSGGICSSLILKIKSQPARLVGQRKVSSVSLHSFGLFVSFVVRTGDPSCHLLLSRGIRSSFVPQIECRVTTVCCISPDQNPVFVREKYLASSPIYARSSVLHACLRSGFPLPGRLGDAQGPRHGCYPLAGFVNHCI